MHGRGCLRLRDLRKAESQPRHLALELSCTTSRGVRDRATVIAESSSSCTPFCSCARCSWPLSCSRAALSFRFLSRRRADAPACLPGSAVCSGCAWPGSAKCASYMLRTTSLQALLARSWEAAAGPGGTERLQAQSQRCSAPGTPPAPRALPLHKEKPSVSCCLLESAVLARTLTWPGTRCKHLQQIRRLACAIL